MKRKAFTLVELVIVIIIVGILSLVAVPIYKKYVERAKITEALACASQIAIAQKIYWMEYSSFYQSYSGSVDSINRSNAVSNDTYLGIDIRNNKYWTLFITKPSSGYDNKVGVINLFDNDSSRLFSYVFNLDGSVTETVLEGKLPAAAILTYPVNKTIEKII